MEKGIEKNDGLTVESLQKQVYELKEELRKSEESAENFRQWWMNAENQRDAALDLLKSLKTIMAAVDVEPTNK